MARREFEGARGQGGGGDRCDEFRHGRAGARSTDSLVSSRQTFFAATLAISAWR
jgi:hypothetical protein